MTEIMDQLDQNTVQHRLNASIPPLRSTEVEYFSEITIPVLLTSTTPDRLFVESLVLRFQSDARQGSVFEEKHCGWELGPGEVREEQVIARPQPLHLENTNTFDVLVRYRILGMKGLSREYSEKHSGSYIIVRSASQAFGKIFISFKQPEDIGLAQILERMARRSGFTPYLAVHHPIPGTSLWERIEPEITSCRMAVVIWTKHTDWGTGVQQEMEICRKQAIPCALLIENGVALPEGYDQEIEYRRFETDDPAPAFSKAISAQREELLRAM